MRRTLDTYHDHYPTRAEVDDALSYAAVHGDILVTRRVKLAERWVVRVDYDEWADPDMGHDTALERVTFGDVR